MLPTRVNLWNKMAYYTKVLLPDEKVLHVGRLHWSIYLRGWLFLAAAVAAGVALWTYAPAPPFLGAPAAQPQDAGAPFPPWLGGVLWIVFLAAFALWVISLVGAWGKRATTEIVVTDKRVIFKEGWLRRRTMEMNMNKVETVDVEQSIWGRLFNYGTVMIRGTGTSYEPLRGIGAPLALRTAITAQ